MTRLRTPVIVVVAWILLLRIMTPWAFALMLVEISDIRVRCILIGIVVLLATRLVAPHYLVAALTALALIVVDEMLPFPSPLDGWIAFDNFQAPVFYALAGVWGGLAWGQFRRSGEHLPADRDFKVDAPYLGRSQYETGNVGHEAPRTCTYLRLWLCAKELSTNPLRHTWLRDPQSGPIGRLSSKSST